MEVVDIRTIGAGPRELRRTERGEGAVRELRLGPGVATGERERTRDEDEVTEWLDARRLGGELRKGRRRPIKRSTIVPKPKPKPKGNEGVKVRRGDEFVGRARVGEEPVPIQHRVGRSGDSTEGHDENRGMLAGSWEGGGRGDREEGVPPPKPEKEVRGIGRRVSAA